ncbi:hypothetical protein WN48_08891 [Eufriesea mexicana]|uniref:Uncharacterized protein n=1 Tax=Eufriesea mexicana TaxID=516756 RepID=A0A310SUI1_9HYME|nr:hypothetical protein WN48_08891 [Eufriesea mexicana]
MFSLLMPPRGEFQMSKAEPRVACTYLASSVPPTSPPRFACVLDPRDKEFRHSITSNLDRMEHTWNGIDDRQRNEPPDPSNDQSQRYGRKRRKEKAEPKEPGFPDRISGSEEGANVTRHPVDELRSRRATTSIHELLNIDITRPISSPLDTVDEKEAW